MPADQESFKAIDTPDAKRSTDAGLGGSRKATSHITRVGLGHLARRSQTADLLEMLLQL